MPDLIIRAPETVEDIYDIIIYLCSSNSIADRVCFKRIKATQLLDINKSTFEIQNFLLEEDKSLDMLDDE
jgi:hypothetical protein